MSVSSHEQLPLSADGAEDLHVLHVHVSFPEQELRAGTDIEADLPLDARLRIIR